eukprot:TRINITY_DN12862_c0_g1_i2.p1 TRINITY_DN12862_c0_g1~~TRINITY_DN12862_c0_g1_i2.p1  ORF type:complete len:765 (+),score=181.61 TRINITY_DN12862_c0_g1_i2:38-2296(+)
MSDDEQGPDDQEGSEQEHEEQAEDQSEGENPAPEEEQEEIPPEKEWTESFSFYAAFLEDEVVKVKVSEGLNLPKWATEALSDSPYWMQKSIEKAKEAGEEVKINIPLSIESCGSGYYELREQRAEEAPEPEKEPAEEEEEQEREEVIEEQEPLNPEIDVDLLTLIAEVSPDCAGYLMSLEGTSLEGVVEWCGTTLPKNKNFNTSFLSAIAKAKTLNTAMSLRVSFDYFFDREDKTDDSYQFFHSLLQQWLSAGLEPDHFPSPCGFNNHRDIHLLHKLLFSLSVSATEHLSAVPEPAEDGGEESVEMKPFLPKYLCGILEELRQLSALKFPAALKVVCPTVPELEGTYQRRGMCGDRPRYWFGDVTTTKTAYDITFSSLYGWRLSVVGGEALFSCGVSGTDLLPMMPDRWIHKSQNLTDKNEQLFITPLNLYNVVPKNKHIESSPTEDPILTRTYAARETPPKQLRLYFSDLLLYILAEGVKYGLVTQFRKLLKFKTSKPRHVGEPVGFYHLLLMSVPKLRDEETICTIFKLAPAVVCPLGLVDIKPFLAEVASSKVLSDSQLQYLLGLIYRQVLQYQGGDEDGKMSESTVDISLCVMKAKDFNQQYEKACDLLIENPPSIIEELQQLAAAVPIRWDSQFMHRSVMANCVTVVEWLLDSGLPAECQETQHQEIIPLVPLAMEHKLTDMLLMLVSKGYQINNWWVKGTEYGLKYIEREFDASSANKILTAWNDKENLRAIDPSTTYGMRRQVCI